MNNIDLKKLIIPNIPYLLFVWLFSGKKEPEAPQEKTRKQKIRHDPREQPQTEPQKPPEPQNQTAQEAAQPFPASPDASPLSHAPGTAPKQDTADTYLASWLTVKLFVPYPIADCTAYSSDISGSASVISIPEVSPRPNISAYFARVSVPRSLS